MHRVEFRPEAHAQLLELFAHIAEVSSPEIAAKFTGGIVDHCLSLGTFPLRGTRRDDLRPGLRTIGYKRRVTIAFVATEETVTILGVFYGGQSIVANFGS